MHHIAVVRSNATLVTFAVADDVLFGQTELLAQVSTKLNGLQINLLEVGAVREIVFTNFESNMRVNLQRHRRASHGDPKAASGR